MDYKRREFIRISGSLAAALALAPIACKLSSDKSEKKTETAPASVGLEKFGIQLYTLRDVIPTDPKGVLKQLASFGYREIESYEGPQGMFWGMSAKEFKTYMDELGMAIVASHCDINKDFEKKAGEAASIGMKYLICPWVGPQKTLDDFKKLGEEFNKRGEICRKNGIGFAYHNHDYSFKPLEGELPQDVMMKGTDPAIVFYEMDIYWVVTAGADPEAWLKKYPNRFKLSHVKDRKKAAPPTDTDASVIVGTGSIDFNKVLKTAKENGMEYFIVEQEKYENSTPMKSAQADADYMKKLAI